MRFLPFLGLLGVVGCATAGEADDGVAADEENLTSDPTAAVHVEGCPRASGLCGSDVVELGRLVSERVKSDRAAAIRDKGVHHFVRERGAGLFLWNVATDVGKKASAGDVATAADEFFPAYEARSFAMADAPPKTPACTKREVIVFSPGLFRISKNELADPIEGLEEAFPCVDVVRVDAQANAGSPEDSGDKIAEAVAKLDPNVPVHFLGHSAGSASVLYAFANHPEVAARARTVISLQPVAHGTEVVDRLTPPFLRPEALAQLSVRTSDRFWEEHGAKMPTTALYLTLRGIVTDAGKNIPLSNRPFFELLRRVDRDRPFNDMQVRLERQPLGGPLAEVEVLSRVVEGNHYQWGLSSDDVPGIVMPSSMLDRIPRRAYFLGYYQALHEAGLFAAE